MLLATSALGFTARRTLTVPRAPAIAPAVGQLRMMSEAAKKGYWVGNFTPLPDADMDEFAELFSSIGADRAARTCAKASDDAAARWPAPWMVVAVAACLAVARPYPRLLADVLS